MIPEPGQEEDGIVRDRKTSFVLAGYADASVAP
jgi:hypothetical protein